MKKFLLSLAAIPAVALAMPASAQTYVNSQASANAAVQNQIVQLQAQLDAGVRTGTIDRTERRRLRQELRTLTRLRAQYARNGLSQQEFSLLQQRVGSLSQQIQIAGGYAQGYNQYNQYGQTYQTSPYTTDRYGRRVLAPGYTYDQYGRPVQTGYYGQGGPYVEYPETRSNSNGILGNILGGVLGGGGTGGNILGSILGNGGLRVGDLITGTIGSVLGGAPSGYNSAYQNRNDVYFRSDGQRVYEIDARTNTVVRIHPLR